YGLTRRSVIQAEGFAETFRRDRTVVFPNSGIAVARHSDAELLFFAMPNGIAGKGSHTHNDKLSIVLRIAGQQLLCDSGTYCYLRDANSRNRFRSTAAHNTLVVDGQEQNSISPSTQLLFYVPDEADVSPIKHSESSSGMELRASHAGYKGKAGVTHIRILRLRGEDELEIEDVLQGAGTHSCESNLHFGPAWKVVSIKEEEGGIVCKVRGPRDVTILFSSSARLQGNLQVAELSPTFAGTRIPIDKISIRANAILPTHLTTRIMWNEEVEMLSSELREQFVKQ